MARLATIGTGIPTVYTPHALSRSRLALAAELALRRRAARMIAVSESEREFALRNRIADEGRTVVIHNGVELTPPPPLAQALRTLLGVGQDVPLIGSVGRLTRQKAPEVFIAACELVGRQLTDAHFVLIGVGAQHTELVSTLRGTTIESRFHLVPWLPNAAAAMSELDVFASSSRFEGAPYTPLEAMRAGTPVVVTDVPGNRDVVRGDENGLVVPPDSPAELADAIYRLLSDDLLRTRLARNAKGTVARCDVRAMAEATCSVYRELLAPRSSERTERAKALGVGVNALP